MASSISSRPCMTLFAHAPAGMLLLPTVPGEAVQSTVFNPSEGACASVSGATTLVQLETGTIFALRGGPHTRALCLNKMRQGLTGHVFNCPAGTVVVQVPSTESGCSGACLACLSGGPAFGARPLTLCWPTHLAAEPDGVKAAVQKVSSGVHAQTTTAMTHRLTPTRALHAPPTTRRSSSWTRACCPPAASGSQQPAATQPSPAQRQTSPFHTVRGAGLWCPLIWRVRPPDTAFVFADTGPLLNTESPTPRDWIITEGYAMRALQLRGTLPQYGAPTSISNQWQDCHTVCSQTPGCAAYKWDLDTGLCLQYQNEPNATNLLVPCGSSCVFGYRIPGSCGRSASQGIA